MYADNTKIRQTWIEEEIEKCEDELAFSNVIVQLKMVWNGYLTRIFISLSVFYQSFRASKPVAALRISNIRLLVYLFF